MYCVYFTIAYTPIGPRAGQCPPPFRVNQYVKPPTDSMRFPTENVYFSVYYNTSNSGNRPTPSGNFSLGPPGYNTSVATPKHNGTLGSGASFSQSSRSSLNTSGSKSASFSDKIGFSAIKDPSPPKGLSPPRTGKG